MKLTRAERIFAMILLVVMAGIVVHAPLSVWLGTVLPRYALLIKSWKEILLLIAAGLALVIIARRRLWGELAADWLVRVAACYVVLHLLLAVVLFKGGAQTAAGLLIDLRFVGYLLLTYLLVKIAPWYRLRLTVTAALGAVVVMGFGVLQLFLPADILRHIGYSHSTIEPYLTVDKNPNYIRINSTLRGPNPLGAYAAMTLAMIASLLARERRRLKTSARRWSFAAMTLATLVVLWVSYSRSALLGAVLAVTAVLLFALGPRIPRAAWIGAGAALLLVIVGLTAARHSSFVENVILHDNPGTGASVTSNEGHASSLIHGARRMLVQPFGAGVGSTGSASLLGESAAIVEDQYLFVAHEAGWLGLVLFLWLYGLILRRLYRDRGDWLSLGLLASGLALAFIGILLPVWADDTVSLVWWGLAGAALGTVKGKNGHGRTGK